MKLVGCEGRVVGKPAIVRSGAPSARVTPLGLLVTRSCKRGTYANRAPCPCVTHPGVWHSFMGHRCDKWHTPLGWMLPLRIASRTPPQAFEFLPQPLNHDLRLLCGCHSVLRHCHRLAVVVTALSASATGFAIAATAILIAVTEFSISATAVERSPQRCRPVPHVLDCIYRLWMSLHGCWKARTAVG
jgi:hypothetical protein